jgi:outer membrane receptor protein involved in Fe transport
MRNSALVTSSTSTSRGVDAYDVFDFNARVTLPGETSLRFTVTNLLNEEPPQAGDTVGNFDTQNYDTLGRYFTVAVTKSF